MYSSNRPFQIISDGRDLYVIISETQAIRVESAFLQNVNHRVEYPFTDVSTFGGERFAVRGPMYCEVDFSVRGGKYEIINPGDILTDFFRSTSIRDLLKEINKKIEERG